MKIIIIILICLFFSLTMTPINEHITNPPPPQKPIAGPPPEKPQPQPESGLQAQINMLSTQITTTNAMALEAKQKSDNIASQIDQIKKELEKKIDT